MRGELTAAQYSAGNWFAQLEDSYRRALCIKGIRTSTGERYTPGHPPDPFSSVGWDIAAAELATLRKFDSARLAGMACGTRQVQNVLVYRDRRRDARWLCGSLCRGRRVLGSGVSSDAGAEEHAE